MPRKKHNELVAGLFVLLTLALLIGVLVWLGAADMFKPARQRAYFYISEKTGDLQLAEGSLVKSGGAPIGRIAKIERQPA